MQTEIIEVSKRFQKLGCPAELEVIPYLFKPRRHKNGYIVTVVAVYVPSALRTIFAASACSPEDIFNADTAENIAGVRAMAQTIRVIAGIGARDSLIGVSGSETVLHANGKSLRLKTIYERLVPVIAENAEKAAVRKEFKQMLRKHKTILAGNVLRICDTVRNEKIRELLRKDNATYSKSVDPQPRLGQVL